MAHLVDGVHVPNVVLGGELVGVPLKVLGVRACGTFPCAHVRLPQRWPRTTRSPAGAPCPSRIHPGRGRPPRGPAWGRYAGWNLCMHVSAGAVLDADDRRLGDAARPRVELLGLVLVLLQAAHVDLVHLHFPRELPLRLEGFPDPVRHVPSGLLRDAEFPVQPHRTDALQAGGVQVDGIRPILQRDLGSVHGSARADGEVAVAAAAPVGHRLAVLAFLGVHGAAVRAEPSLVPDNGFEPPFGGFVRREHGHRTRGRSCPRGRFCRVPSALFRPIQESA